ncbi:caspase family protein [Corallococcus llansteffanensis]|uniref:Caspase family protein n=1 Tax=Corallococcus llansteffanensis TaxID=2316731 RepID=A0A3A8PRA8_9BACT|nr:caspase family protein [Corallococcus llansteffanensis]RKH54992.1 caspase family protein [Corallococcus llansteffanensis]
MNKLEMLLGAALLLAAPEALADTVRRALVIAHNGSDDPALAPLRYADDDGVLWAETLKRLGVDTTLLVDPDESTREAGSLMLKAARAPTREAVEQAVKRLQAASLADHAAGRQVDVLIVYVGHGNTDDAGRAYFTLADARLDRTSLYSEVVDPLGADYVHVIADACRASGVVGRRGGTPDAALLAELRGVLAREQLASRPNVGALFAESDDGETHEWSRIRAGVFSHVARSGLLGGADINGDGQVEYSELAAFVAASLHGVKGMPARLSVNAFAPTAAPRRPLVGPAPEGPSVTFPAGFEYARLSVEDADGQRLVDVRRSPQQWTQILLPPRDVYWVRAPDAEARVTLAQLSAGTPEFHPRELQERGPAEEALRQGLFAVPLDRSFYDEYVVAAGLVPVDFTAFQPSTVGGLMPRLSAPSSATGSAWELGLGAGRSPLGLASFATGPSLSWRTPSASMHLLYYGARGAYGVTPLASRDGIRLHRFTLEGLVGLQNPARTPLFAEVGVGWGVLGLTAPGFRQADPLLLTSHVAAGITGRLAGMKLRLSAQVGLDRVTANGRTGMDPQYGLEISLRR